jgi:hypothetical protein
MDTEAPTKEQLEAALAEIDKAQERNTSSAEILRKNSTHPAVIGIASELDSQHTEITNAEPGQRYRASSEKGP